MTSAGSEVTCECCYTHTCAHTHMPAVDFTIVCFPSTESTPVGFASAFIAATFCWGAALFETPRQWLALWFMLVRAQHHVEKDNFTKKLSEIFQGQIILIAEKFVPLHGSCRTFFFPDSFWTCQCCESPPDTFSTTVSWNQTWCLSVIHHSTLLFQEHTSNTIWTAYFHLGNNYCSCLATKQHRHPWLLHFSIAAASLLFSPRQKFHHKLQLVPNSATHFTRTF